ncbi:MAG: TIGR02594 family protein, partial [Gammaproteobacteria bacterium]|nr:TIGR02594 family protein [Gammaproteobacteria bacterium]
MTEQELALETRKLDLEEKKHADDVALRKRELKIRELAGQESAWRSPLFLAVVAAMIGLAGNAVVALINGISERSLERQKAEAGRILQALKTGDPDNAAENLKLLVDTKLVDKTALDIQSYLDGR